MLYMDITGVVHGRYRLCTWKSQMLYIDVVDVPQGCLASLWTVAPVFHSVYPPFARFTEVRLYSPRENSVIGDSDNVYIHILPP